MVTFKNSKIDSFIKREKRFLSYMKNEGLVFCPNPGKMADILVPESECIISEQGTKINYRWEAIKINNEWVGVNTQNPNKLASELITKLFPDEIFKSEVRFGGYRADFASENVVVEVKNVHWIPKNEGTVAYFPDCVTSRGARQLRDLMEISKTRKCYVIYIVQRSSATCVSISKEADKDYYYASLEAKNAGIQSLAFNCEISLEGVKIKNQIEFI